jgi:Zn-dependent peptidase ImmA (M78 family)/DNA-binding XRE family transcriptional regulator
MEPKNIPKNLVTIRDRLGLSQKAVAERLQVSASLLSKWEKGERSPDSTQLVRIAGIYGVGLGFLMGAPIAGFKPRVQVTMPKNEKQQINQVLNEASEQIHLLDRAWSLCEKAPVRFGLRLEWSDKDLPEQAEMLRKMLNLNRRISLPELKQALEEHNIFVFDWYMPSKLYGLSYRENFTVIFLNRTLGQNANSEASRLFTLAHELAHLLYHFHKGATTEVSDMASRKDPHEVQANRFAAEFLLPERELDARITSLGKSGFKQPSVFHRVAHEWNISPEALFYRLAGKGLLTWAETKRFYQKKPAAKASTEIRFRVDNISEQVPLSMIDAGLTAYAEEKISLGKLADWWHAPLELVSTFVSQLEMAESGDLGLDWTSDDAETEADPNDEIPF